MATHLEEAQQVEQRVRLLRQAVLSKKVLSQEKLVELLAEPSSSSSQ